MNNIIMSLTEEEWRRIVIALTKQGFYDEDIELLKKIEKYLDAIADGYVVFKESGE